MISLLIFFNLNLENNLLLIKGNVPGPKKGLVIIREAVKALGKTNDAIELVNYNPIVEEVVEATVEETVENVEAKEE